MLSKLVFPEYAVKQAFHEANLDRGDEHVITAMQSDLVTRCLFQIVKGALIHCVHNKRKFISERDIEIGKAMCVFPFKEAPPNAGALLDGNEFVNMVNQHIQMCVTHMQKHIDLKQEQYKISSETLTKLQTEVEACIRGFVHKLAMSSDSVTFKQFENMMATVLGDPSYTQFEQGYVVF